MRPGLYGSCALECLMAGHEASAERRLRQAHDILRAALRTYERTGDIPFGSTRAKEALRLAEAILAESPCDG